MTGLPDTSKVRKIAELRDPANPGGVTIDGAPVEVTALDGGSPVIRR